MTETVQKTALPQVMPAGGQVVAVVPQTVEEIFRVSSGVVKSGLAPYALTGRLDTPADVTRATSAVAIVIMAGAELGLPPMVSLRSFTAINGRPALYGDGLINVVRRSGRAKKLRVEYTSGTDFRLFIRAGKLREPYGETPEALAADLASIREEFLALPIDERTGGYCDAERVDSGESKVVIFTVAQAKRAGLWQTDALVWKDVWSGPKGNRTSKREQVPNDSPWWRYPERMLGWRAAGFCLRELFGDVLGGITDDWEAREISGMVDVTPTSSRPADLRPSEILPEVPEDEPLPKSDLPEGGKSEAEQPNSEVAQNSNSAAEAADDFSHDESDVRHPATGEPMTNTSPAPDMDAYFTRLDEEMAPYETDLDFLNAWDDAKVEEQLAGKPEALAWAAELKARHLNRIDGLNRAVAEAEQGQGNLLDSLPQVPE